MSSSLVPPCHGLRDLAPHYRALLCDVWGVIHNGVQSFETSTHALERYREETGGAVILLTNAPRPHQPILTQLAGLGVPETAFDAVVTSGDVTLALVQAAAEEGKAAYHLGPERDRTLFDGIDIELVEEDDADLVINTGLFDDTTETPEDYVHQFERMIERDLPMICANPDLVVERGGKTIFCAGALAEAYDALGGEVVLVGKPYAPVYERAFDVLEGLLGDRPALSDVLAIGDGLRTDIKGATLQGLDALFVTGGIHSSEVGDSETPEAEKVTATLMENNLKSIGFLRDLVW
ncbi:TIGR01459 family HAD-type hydrolase [Coralliovum pocilloporae]|uniref:TIGR01459 family HAD-type hydrolase n=1 Tax=Coralliovum pocilloporae TaxID=3066369 RepID=UPI0033071F63